LQIKRYSKSSIEDNKKKPDKLPPEKHLKIATLDIGGNTKEYSKGDLSFGKDGKPLWIDFQDITEKDLDYIEKTTEIPREEIKKKLIEGSFPRIDHIGEIPSILLWDSRIKNQSDITTEITSPRMLAVLKDANIITLTTDKSELFARIDQPNDQLSKENFIVEVLYSFLNSGAINNYTKL
jgi:Mg2+ and Co2+ transporter CorA